MYSNAINQIDKVLTLLDVTHHFSPFPMFHESNLRPYSWTNYLKINSHFEKKTRMQIEYLFPLKLINLHDVTYESIG